jgi:hypothetical protein
MVKKGVGMFKRIQSIIFVICVVMVFTAQTPRPDDKGQQHGSATRHALLTRPASVVRSAPVAHNYQSRPQAQNRQQFQPRREVPQQFIHRAAPTIQTRTYQPVHQGWTGPRIYAMPAPAPVANNRFLHRQHHKNWQPRYNFYENQYHFYPYVNIASIVELTGGYIVAGPDGQNYYYDQGTFYLQDQTGQYVAVPPPLGIIVNPIAAGARQINVNGQIFYRYKGVFYIQVAQGYQVIGPAQPVSADL